MTTKKYSINLKKKVHQKKQRLFFFIAGFLCYSNSSYAVFPDGRFLLDAGRGILPLPVCCEKVQYYRDDAHVLRHIMGYSLFISLELFVPYRF